MILTKFPPNLPAICGYLLVPQDVHRMDKALNLMEKQEEKEKKEEKVELNKIELSAQNQEEYTLNSQNSNSQSGLSLLV